MATRLHYAPSIARHLIVDAGRRLRPGGLAATLRDAPDGRAFTIVSGPGRSGTSAVARVLHESGVSMGVAFDPPSDQNRVGFYEDTGVRELNWRLVGDLGLGDIRRSRRWPWRSSVLAVAERYEDELSRVAATARDGWKDPNFAVTLEAWLRYLPHRPKLVLCLRSPAAFLHSVSRIYGLVDREQVEGYWERGLRRLLAVARDYRLPLTCVEYDRLLREPETVVGQLSSFVGRPLDPTYVQPELRRFHYAVPRRYRALYDSVRVMGPTGSPPARRDEEGESVETYLEQVRELVQHLDAAKQEWAERVGMPEPALDGAAAVEAVREASAAYVEELHDAQSMIGSVEPPEALEHYHELTRAVIDNERLTAQVTLQAAQRQRAVEDVMKAWEVCSSPEVRARLEAERSRERQRAAGRR